MFQYWAHLSSLPHSVDWALAESVGASMCGYGWCRGGLTGTLAGMTVLIVAAWSLCGLVADGHHAAGALRAASTALVLFGVLLESAKKVESLFTWRPKGRMLAPSLTDREVALLEKAGAALLIFGLFAELLWLPFLDLQPATPVLQDATCIWCLGFTIATVVILGFALRKPLGGSIIAGSQPPVPATSPVKP